MEKLNYTTIQTYQSFSTIKDMDEAVRGFLYIHKSSLSGGTIKVLKFIWRHSVKIIGVSFGKYKTIAEAVDLSRRTVIRSIKKLEELGLIKKIPTFRMNGKQGVNLLVIQPFKPVEESKKKMSPQDVTGLVTPNKAENKQDSLCEKNKKTVNVSNTENGCHSVKILDQPIDISFLPESVHPGFSEAAKPFFQAIDIYKLWNRVQIAYKNSKLDKPLEDVIEIVITSFKHTVFIKKSDKIRTSFEGYFYRLLYAKLIAEKRREFRHLAFDIFEEIYNGGD